MGRKHDFGKKMVEKKRYEIVKYNLKSGDEGSRCELVTREVLLILFFYFKEKLQVFKT